MWENAIIWGNCYICYMPAIWLLKNTLTTQISKYFGRVMQSNKASVANTLFGFNVLLSNIEPFLKHVCIQQHFAVFDSGRRRGPLLIV